MIYSLLISHKEETQSEGFGLVGSSQLHSFSLTSVSGEKKNLSVIKF